MSQHRTGRRHGKNLRAQHRRASLWSAAAATGVLGAASFSLATSVLVSSTQYNDGTGTYGIGGSNWTQMTAALNSATGNQVSFATDFTNLSQLMTYDGLWLDLRDFSATLAPAETSNLQSYIATGRRVVVIGENGGWTAWDNSILSLIGGSFTGWSDGTATPVLANSLTAGITSSSIPVGGTGSGGTSLFTQAVAKLGGPINNVLALLDVGVFQNWSTGSNSVFGSNVAGWIAASNVGGGNWLNATGGDWHTGSNWSGGLAPGSADDVTFDLGPATAAEWDGPPSYALGGYTVSFSANGAANNLIVLNDVPLLDLNGHTLALSGALTIDNQISRSSSLGIADGTVTASTVSIGTTGKGILHVHNQGRLHTGTLGVGYDGANGTLLLEGAGSTLTASGNAFIGASGMTGSANIRSGASATFDHLVGVADSGTAGTIGSLKIETGATVQASSLRITRNQGTGTVTVDNADLSIAGDVAVGGTSLAAGGGTATLNIQNGAEVTIGGALRVWNNTSVVNLTGGTLTSAATDVHSGSITQTGGHHAVGANLKLGASVGSNGTYTLSAGSLTSASYVSIGASGGGTFIQQGGTLSLASSELIVAHAGSTTGSYQMSGGSASTPGYLVVGFAGAGTLTQSGGSISATGGLAMALGGSSSGTMTVSGGTVAIGSVTIGGDTVPGGTGILNISGAGSVTATGPMKIWNNGAAAPGGTRVNLSGGLLSVASLNTDGNLARFNWTGGTLDLTNSNLVFGSGGALGASRTIDAGKTLRVSGTGSATPLSTGNLTVNSSGSLTVNGGSVYARTLDVSGAGGFSFTGGTITVDGGALVPKASELLRVGGTGTLNLDNGAAMSTGQSVVVSGQVTGQLAALNLSGGSDLAITDSSKSLNVGSWQSSTSPGPGGALTIGSASVVTTPALALGTFTSGPFNHGGTGTITIDAGGTLTVANTATLWRGAINVAGGTFNAGTLVDHGAASINWTAGAINLTASDLTVGGTGLLPSPLNISAGKALGVSGTTTVSAGSSVSVTGGTMSTGALAVAGSVGLTGGAASIAGTTTVSTGALLHVNDGTHHVGALNTSGAVSVAGGTLAVAGGTQLDSGSDVTVNGGTFTTGSVALNGGTLNLDSGVFNLTNSALSVGAGGLFGSNLNINAGMTVHVTQAATIEPGARVLSIEGSFSVGSGSANDGTISVTDGSLGFTGTATNATGGRINLIGSTLDAGPSLNNAGRINLIDCVVSGTISGQAGGILNTAGEVTFDSALTGGGSLIISGGSATTFAAGAGVNMMDALAIDASGVLNLNDNDLLIDYSGDSIETAVRQYVIDGRITAVTGDGDTTLAIADNTEWAQGEFNGFEIDDTTVIGKYTYYGDANLDGMVTSDDYVAVDVGIGVGNSWVEGDFDMSGDVTSDDYVAIDVNLGKGSPTPLAFAEMKAEMIALHAAMFGASYVEKLAHAEANGFGATIVPEPGALRPVALAGAATLGRRRRAGTWQ